MRGMIGRSLQRELMACGAAIAVMIVASPALAQTRMFDIPAQSAARGIPAFARQAGVQIIASGATIGAKRTNRVRGNYSVAEGLRLLLQGTGLIASSTGSSGIITIQASGSGEGDAGSAPADQSADIIVTGSRVRGGVATAPVVSISREQMRQAGQNDLGEVVRTIPQNFSGGQNPGVAFGSSSANVNNANATGGSSINLRGLGPDATLTLLNGRRLSYGSFSQAVDVSSIPIAAVDRIEIVADGASAIYGSDAVAGVANIILRPDYNGLATSARLGTATDGGNFQQQYNVVGGTSWGSGGFIATYDFERDTAIRADQRDYTSYVLAPQTMLPSLKRHSVVASAHQEILPGIRLSIDGLYNRRWVNSVQTLTSAVNYTDRTAENWVISPVLQVKLPAQWTMTVSGTYGKDDVVLDQPSYTRAGVLRSRTRNCYCNTVKSAELGVEGVLLNLPAGAARLAAGGGYRENIFDQRSLTSTSRTYGRQHSSFGYGELYIPVVSPGQQVPLIDHLSFTGALRYEDYSTFGGVTTPKLGMVYAPVTGIELKGTWGRSFKAPTLLQQNQAAFALLFPAATLGATGVPATATALVGFGGNHALRPERATTWSTTLSFRPTSVPGLSADISYFSIRYRDRVIEAVGNLFSAFSNPSYAEFLVAGPTAAQQQEVINRAGANGLTNYTGAAYNAANVVAIVNDYYANAAAQYISGVDVNARYRTDIGDGSVTLIGQASRIESKQKNSSTAAFFDLAGTVFNPPTFRARAGFTLEQGPVTFSPFVNYFGGIKDTRSPPARGGASMATIDMTLLYDPNVRDGLLKNLNLSVSVQNLANERPPYLRNTSASVVNYDSTNYSAIGRFVSLTIGKRW